MSGVHDHHDHAGHDHAGHAHGRIDRSQTRGRLALTLLLVAGYMVAEVVGGWWTNSLALLADAGHMLSDAAALALSLFALWVASRPPTPRRTYGYYRAEILAALVNGATLVAISIYILFEAYERLWEPPEVQGKVMMFIAVGGLAVNAVGLWLLHAGRSESLNVRGAWLHLLSDALGSVAAIVGGLLIWAFDWHRADPVVSALIGLLVVHSAWALLKESVSILMESTPGHLDADEVRDALVATPGVREVHDLHIWSITSGMESLSCHVIADEETPSAPLLKALRETLHERFGIEHTTIQIEAPDCGGHASLASCAYPRQE